jgi:protein tyrosine phosphatase (PTP) superfamily phosphohydrolase (DUF442 family)
MRNRVQFLSLFFCTAASMWMSLLVAQDSPMPAKLALKHLPNPIEVRAGLISGGLPQGDQAFQELERLGIKTIISVDGARPDVQMAQRYSMRYVHIPHGYDGISESTLEKLAKAAAEFPGPIYIHCHHGKHRSPAAAAAICVAQGTLKPQQALRILELAGTNPSYKGLFQSVIHAKQIDPAVLEKLRFEFPAQCDVPPLVDAMVALEETVAKLSKVAEARWKANASSDQVDAAHEAVLLREHFEEMQRLDDVSKYPPTFRQMLKESEQSAWLIESMLNPYRNGNPLATKESAPLNVELSQLKQVHRKALDVNWNAIRANCTACHKQFRDNGATKP